MSIYTGRQVFPLNVKRRSSIIQLLPLLECDPTVCLPEKSKVTRGLVRGWPNFSREDKLLGHTPSRVIIGILYRIFLHQKPSNRIPAGLQKYSIQYIKFLLRLQRRACRWTPCFLSVESREVTIIGNTWGSRGGFPHERWILLWDLTISGWLNEWINITWQCFIKSDSRYLYEYII